MHKYVVYLWNLVPVINFLYDFLKNRRGVYGLPAISVFLLLCQFPILRFIVIYSRYPLNWTKIN